MKNLKETFPLSCHVIEQKIVKKERVVFKNASNQKSEKKEEKDEILLRPKISIQGIEYKI